MKKFISHLLTTCRIYSIRSVIALSFTVIIVIAMFFEGFMLYRIFLGAAEKNSLSSNEQIVNQLSLNLESYLKGMIEISGLVSDEFTSAVISGQNNLKSVLYMTSKMRRDVVGLTVFSENGDVVLTDSLGVMDPDFDVNRLEWFKVLVSQTEKYQFLPPYVQRMHVMRRPWVVSLCKTLTISDPQAGSQRYITEVDMNFSAIEELCKSVQLGKRGYIYITDKDANLIYHPQQQIIYANLKTENTGFTSSSPDGSYFENFEGERRLVTVKTLNYTGWKVVGIGYVEELVAVKNQIKYFFILVSVVGLIIVVLISLFVSAKISQPIQLLQEEMKQVEQGNFDISIDVKGEDEVKELSRTFNLMVARIRSLMNQIVEEQEAKRISEMKALQAQINPHFLYNTLDSIVWMNENHKYQGVTTMVAALAKLFRISISRGNELITVRDELEHAKSYLVIQKIRYKNKFDFSIEAPPEAMEFKTVKLILQPIIENAIYHGVEHLYEEGHIAVSVVVEADRIKLHVRDNGYGIRPEVMDGLLNRDSKDESGVGLKNVHQRIQLYFGDAYGVSIASELDVGTTVTVTLPKCIPESAVTV